MNISSRFSEFGMTGAFFWIMQMIYFAIAHDQQALQSIAAWLSAINPYLALLDSLPQNFADISSTLITVVGLIGIFITGLILNLFGTYFFLFEDFLFNRHLQHNQGWLDELTGDCPGVVSSDYAWLRDTFRPALYLDPRMLLRLTSASSRLQAFLLSYIHVFCDNGTPEQLNDVIHLWRTARAIGITFWLLALETLLFYLLEDHGSFQAVIGWGVLLFLAGIYITLRPYNRLCHALFTLACAVHGRARR